MVVLSSFCWQFSYPASILQKNYLVTWNMRMTERFFSFEHNPEKMLEKSAKKCWIRNLYRCFWSFPNFYDNLSIFWAHQHVVLQNEHLRTLLRTPYSVLNWLISFIFGTGDFKLQSSRRKSWVRPFSTTCFHMALLKWK